MNYEDKFSAFIKMLSKAKKGEIDVVLVQDPRDLGDDYAEIVESLNRISDAEVSLRVLSRIERGP